MVDPVPNLYHDRNPLRVDLLPDGWEKQVVESSFRTPATRKAYFNNPFTVYFLVLVSISTLAGVLGGRLVYGVSSFVPLISLPTLIIAAGVAMYWALPRFLGDHPVRLWINQLFIPFILWLMAYVLGLPAFVLLLVCAAAMLYTVDALTGNYVAWLMADRRVDLSVRRKVAAKWRDRFRQNSWWTALYNLASRPKQQEIFDAYPVSLAAFGLVMLLAAAVTATGGLTVIDRLTLVLAIVTYLALFGVVGRLLFGAVPVAHRLAFRATIEALRNWIGYNPRDQKFPGLHQSPYGKNRRRLVILGATMFLSGASLIVVGCYFPLAMLIYGERPWAAAYSRYEHLLHADNTGAKNIGTITPEELRPYERLVYDQLPAEEKGVFLKQKLDRINASVAATARPRNPEPSAESYEYLHSQPEAWLLANFAIPPDIPEVAVLTVLLSTMLCLVTPAGFLLLVHWSLVGHDLALLTHRVNQTELWQHTDAGEDEQAVEHNPEFAAQVDAIRDAEDPAHRQYVFLGHATHVDHDDACPVLVHRRILREHAHITGDSGSGKTSRGIAPMAHQLVRFAQEQRDCSIVVIDLKGDPALFHGLREESQSVRKLLRPLAEDEIPPEPIPFRYYRDQIGLATHRFNPLLQDYLDGADPDRKGEVVMKALGIAQEGEGGPDYFSNLQRVLIYRLFRTFPDVSSFKEMLDCFDHQAKILFRGMERKLVQDSFLIRGKIELLSRCQALNDARKAEEQIDFLDIFRRPQLVYFYLPTTTSEIDRQVARFALHSLLNAGESLPPDERLQVYCIIDEFQEIVAGSIREILRKVRSSDVSLILANQIPADLRTVGANLEETVEGNTALKWNFRMSSVDQREQLVQSSGEFIEYLQTVTPSIREDTFAWGFDFSYAQERRANLPANALAWGSFHEDLSVVQLSKGQGFTQFFRPFLMHTMHHVAEGTHRRRTRESWPTGDSDTIVTRPTRQPSAERTHEPQA